MRRLARNPEVVIVQNPAPGSFRRSRMKRHKKRRSARRNRGHSRRRSTRRNRGNAYSRFVKKHKGLFKRMGFRSASKKISSMWRKKK